MLFIPKQILAQLFEHAKRGLPEEVCGYLAGTDRIIKQHFELTNIDHSPEHFSFDPAEQFKALHESRNAGLEILANYHSHPETPARPSQEDIRLAYDPNISYVIISLADSISPEIKAFKIKSGEVTEEEIILD